MPNSGAKSLKTPHAGEQPIRLHAIHYLNAHEAEADKALIIPFTVFITAVTAV
jgi:hypothetical protein